VNNSEVLSKYNELVTLFKPHGSSPVIFFIKLNYLYMKNTESIIYFILGIINFIIFAFDIQYHRDVMSWMWLLTSQIFFMFSLIRTIENILKK
jgi:hypothetical protein